MNKKNRNVWKLWIIPNRLTKDDDTDGIADVSTVNDTATNEDIARRIVEMGSEYNYDSILHIINRRDEVEFEILIGGRSFMSKNMRHAPRVKGNWYGIKPTPNYSLHLATFDTVMTNYMRNGLQGVKYEVLGTKVTSGIISLVIDTSTGLSDGTITSEDDIKILGEKIRVLDNGTNDPDVGVFFVAANNIRHRVTRRLTENNPSSVIARVPLLPPGAYTLEIVTYFTSGSVTLTASRAITYALPLTII